MTQEEKQEIISELKTYILEHLKVNVEGYYEPYSGQSEHYHQTSIEFE